MRLKTGLNKRTLGTLRGTLMTMRHWTVVNLMQTMFLVSKTLWTQSLPTHFLPCHFLQILGKIWLILHILTFANKVEVQRVLTKCALKENKHFMISRSTTTKLCAKCVDESCKWYVCAIMKPNLHRLWMAIVYKGPHTCIWIGVRNDGRMMSCNFIAECILKKLCEDHTTPIKHIRAMIESKYEGHKPSYYKV